MAIALFESLCKLCKHRQGFGCAAYPTRIPREIRDMHVDHRQPYLGDNGIRFESKDDSDDTRRRLENVRLRPGRVPAGTNDLDRRLSRIWKNLPFEDARERFLFTRQVRAANHFEELPEWCRALVLKAEASDSPKEESETDAELLAELPQKTAHLILEVANQTVEPIRET